MSIANIEYIHVFKTQTQHRNMCLKKSLEILLNLFRELANYLFLVLKRLKNINLGDCWYKLVNQHL